jgi:SAM-dependent methyltransferase
MGDLDRILRTASRVGHPIDESTAAILDFGCGAGRTVVEGRSRGIRISGCDLARSMEGAPRELLGSALQRIDEQTYRLPFEDGQFDLVFSHQVLEHVMNYESAFREIRRILKPGGLSMHIFPSRYGPVETHVWVPLGTMIRTRRWLSLWALLGIRNEFQKGLSARRVAELNFDYLNSETNYLTRRQIRSELGKFFSEVRFAEKPYLAAGNRYGPLLSKVPLVPSIYSTLVHRVVVTR